MSDPVLVHALTAGMCEGLALREEPEIRAYPGGPRIPSCAVQYPGGEVR